MSSSPPSYSRSHDPIHRLRETFGEGIIEIEDNIVWFSDRDEHKLKKLLTLLFYLRDMTTESNRAVEKASAHLEAARIVQDIQIRDTTIRKRVLDRVAEIIFERINPDSYLEFPIKDLLKMMALIFNLASDEDYVESYNMAYRILKRQTE